jgi:hypothetical protein
MATFYLLPPRACLQDALAGLLGKLLPGLPVPANAWDQLAAVAVADATDAVYLVPRDDLPDGEPVADALAEGFGADPGDRVVEVPSGGGVARVWRVPGGVSGSAAA